MGRRSRVLDAGGLICTPPRTRQEKAARAIQLNNFGKVNDLSQNEQLIFVRVCACGLHEEDCCHCLE